MSQLPGLWKRLGRFGSHGGHGGHGAEVPGLPLKKDYLNFLKGSVTGVIFGGETAPRIVTLRVVISRTC